MQSYNIAFNYIVIVVGNHIDHFCPTDVDTIRFSEYNQEGFKITVNKIADISPLNREGADIGPGDDIAIERSPRQGDDFTVMELDFSVWPEGDSPFMVTVTFRRDGIPDKEFQEVSSAP